MPPETWPDLIFKHGVEGALMVFIGALLSTRFYTKQHHADVVKGMEERCVRAEKEAVFWRDRYFNARDDAVRTISTQEDQLKLISALREAIKRDNGGL